MSYDEWDNEIEQPLAEDAIETRIKSAFAPLKCEVAWTDAGNRLHFQVFDTDGVTELFQKELSRWQAQSPSELHGLLSDYRRSLMEQSGCRLDPWPETI